MNDGAWVELGRFFKPPTPAIGKTGGSLGRLNLKKCFEGVAKLDMKTLDSTHRFYEAHGIHAKDKEYLPSSRPS